jgi:hypothetical protein
MPLSPGPGSVSSRRRSGRCDPSDRLRLGHARQAATRRVGASGVDGDLAHDRAGFRAHGVRHGRAQSRRGVALDRGSREPAQLRQLHARPCPQGRHRVRRHDLMPYATPTACREQPCPRPAVERGRCAVHRQTMSERGYGVEHQAERRAALPGARCESCGCDGGTRGLQRDHRVPASMGGGQDSSNKRWLCRCPEHRCHDRVGARVDRVSTSDCIFDARLHNPTPVRESVPLTPPRYPGRPCM